MMKFRLYFDKDADERFLNNMSAKGYALKRFFLGFYTFKKSQPGEYTYRIELIQDRDSLDKKELYSLIEDVGGELVQTWGIWAIFRKKGDFELYSDNESKISYYKRIKKTFFCLSMGELCILPSQYSMLGRTDITKYTAPLITVIFLAMILQVYKCGRKIKQLEEDL